MDRDSRQIALVWLAKAAGNPKQQRIPGTPAAVL
jgi:hypothetical protein